MNLKTRIYQTLSELNRDFQQAADSMARLRELKIMPDNFIRARAHRVEEMRADINRCLTLVLHEIEEQESCRFASLARADEAAGEPVSEEVPFISEELHQASQ